MASLPGLWILVIINVLEQFVGYLGILQEKLRSFQMVVQFSVTAPRS